MKQTVNIAEMSTAIFSDLHGKIGDLLRFLDQTGNSRRFEDLGSTFQAQEMFQAEDFKVAFVGHSHSPGWWTLTPERPVWTHAEVGTELEIEDSRLIVDVGSLGEPKQPGDARYVILEGSRVRWCGLQGRALST